MALTEYDTLTVPEGDGSNDPIALGGALDVLTSQAFVVNKGSVTLFLVATGHAGAKANPDAWGRPIYANGEVVLNAGIVLGELGLLAEGGSGSALVIAK
jgi:hypothetical protein